LEYNRFVALRTPIWDRFEDALGRAQARRGKALDYGELEQLAFDYRRVLHDYALARSRYADTSTARRLQRLAALGTRLLQRDHGRRLPSLTRFVTHTFPSTFKRRLPEILVALCLFLGSGLLGLAITFVYPNFGLVFTGPGALEGLQEGRLWTDALTEDIAPMAAAGIGANNIRVALMGWAGGLTAGLLTLYLVFYNGLMLGSVIGLTLHHSLVGGLLTFVSAHGPLEISMILVCSGGGLVLARGLITSDDRPRTVALREAARDALVLLVGCLPWLALLAAVEAFISPAVGLSPQLKLAIGLALEALFLLFALNPQSMNTSMSTSSDRPTQGHTP